MKNTLVLAVLFSFSFHAVPAGGFEDARPGEDFTRKDRTELLFSTKFQFTPENVPVVTVGVVEDEKEIAFLSEGPLVFMPEGEGGPSVRVGRGRTECIATMDDSRPAVIRYWPALERVPARELGPVREARNRWTQAGLAVKTFEQGSVFGFYGRILDNRRVVVVEDVSFEDRAAAQAHLDELAATHGIDTPELYEEVIRRPDGRVRVRCLGHEATMEFPGMVVVNPSAGKFIRIRNVAFHKLYNEGKREDRSYRGSIIFTADRNGRLAAVNSVDAETLLKGLVPSEIYNDAPMEALKAQAVVARGELFAKLGNRHTADPYMVCADVHCQAYRGMERENERTSRAVEETAGMMAFFKDELVDSVYSSSCGGHSESGANVWQGSNHEYLVGVPDAAGQVKAFARGVTEESVREFIMNPPKDSWCGKSRFGKSAFRWTRTLTDDEIVAGVKKITGTDIGRFKGFEVMGRGVSGRMTRLKVIGTDATVEIAPELRIRQALGSLKSSTFVWNRGNGSVTFTGAGFGHGVGMCQNGAIGMADAGRTYQQILGHYYSGSEVVKIY